MSTLALERDCLAQRVEFGEDSFVVVLDDGRTLSVPLTWYPRLLHGEKNEREKYELIGNGEGIHWPDLDEDISVEGLLAGRRSRERPESLDSWLKSRTKRSDPTKPPEG